MCWKRSRQPVSYPVFLLSMQESQALTEVDRVPAPASHLFARTRSFHRPTFIRPARNSSTTRRSRRATREKWTVTWFWSCAVACLTVVVVRSRGILNSLMKCAPPVRSYWESLRRTRRFIESYLYSLTKSSIINPYSVCFTVLTRSLPYIFSPLYFFLFLLSFSDFSLASPLSFSRLCLS